MGMSSCQGFGKEGRKAGAWWGVSTLGGLSSPAPSLSQAPFVSVMRFRMERMDLQAQSQETVAQIPGDPTPER